jgi:hypothetical protein
LQYFLALALYYIGISVLTCTSDEEEAMWECPMVSLMWSEVIESVDPRRKKGTSVILR